MKELSYVDSVLFLFLLLTMFLAAPAFAIPGFNEHTNENVQYIDDSELTEYAKKLEDAYHKKYYVRVSPTEIVSKAPMGSYDREVTIPILNFMAEQQRQGKPGYFEY